MAYFGRKPEKPGSVPGAASGGKESDTAGKLRSVGRQVARGRQARSTRNIRSQRGAR